MIFDLQRFDTTENTNSITIICGASGELTYDSSSANLTSADIQINKLALVSIGEGGSSEVGG